MEYTIKVAWKRQSRAVAQAQDKAASAGGFWLLLTLAVGALDAIVLAVISVMATVAAVAH